MLIHKVMFCFIRPSNKYSSCDTIPLSRSSPAMEIMNGVNKHYMCIKLVTNKNNKYSVPVTISKTYIV